MGSHSELVKIGSVFIRSNGENTAARNRKNLSFKVIADPDSIHMNVSIDLCSYDSEVH